jgi:hypothetical protein
MTSLESFLSGSKKVKEPATPMEPASGSFMCQNLECQETVYEGYIDRSHNRLKWVCSNGHESSVVI